MDGLLYVADVEAPGASQSATGPSSLETVVWNPFNPVELCCSTEDGFVASYDARNLSCPVSSLKAHKGACRVTFSPGVQNLVATCGSDKLVKVWDFQGLAQVAERDMHVGGLFALEFYKDSPFIVGCGGTEGILGIWDTEENSTVAEKFVVTR